MACVGSAARVAATVAASAASSGSGTTRQTRPQASACAADTGSPSIAMPRARASPTRRGSTQVPPASGIRPILTKAWMKRAPCPASTMSQASARLAPAPAATPCTAQTTGLDRVRMAVIRGLKRVSSVAPRSWSGVTSVRSWPAQKPRPAPASSTLRTAPSASAPCRASMRAACMAPSIEFSRSGRFSVRRSTPPSCATSKLSSKRHLPARRRTLRPRCSTPRCGRGAPCQAFSGLPFGSAMASPRRRLR